MPQLYGFAELSSVTGMSTSTLSTLLHRSRANREEGKSTPNDIPEPDALFGMSPAWKEATVLAWLQVRAKSPRVKRAVDPEQSLKQGRAVPLTQNSEPVVVEAVPTVTVAAEEPATLRGRFRSLVGKRRRPMATKEKS